MKINKELLKGSTELIVLSVLENENMYGYQMIKKLKEKGWIISYWDEIGGKKRKYYSITKDGKKKLKDKKEEWQIFSSSMNKIIGGVLFES